MPASNDVTPIHSSTDIGSLPMIEPQQLQGTILPTATTEPLNATLAAMDVLDQDPSSADETQSSSSHILATKKRKSTSDILVTSPSFLKSKDDRVAVRHTRRRTNKRQNSAKLRKQITRSAEFVDDDDETEHPKQPTSVRRKGLSMLEIFSSDDEQNDDVIWIYTQKTSTELGKKLKLSKTQIGLLHDSVKDAVQRLIDQTENPTVKIIDFNFLFSNEHYMPAFPKPTSEVTQFLLESQNLSPKFHLMKNIILIRDFQK